MIGSYKPSILKRARNKQTTFYRYELSYRKYIGLDHIVLAKQQRGINVQTKI